MSAKTTRKHDIFYREVQFFEGDKYSYCGHLQYLITRDLLLTAQETLFMITDIATQAKPKTTNSKQTLHTEDGKRADRHLLLGEEVY